MERKITRYEYWILVNETADWSRGEINISPKNIQLNILENLVI
jgi:hypothetical protein